MTNKKGFLPNFTKLLRTKGGGPTKAPGEAHLSASEPSNVTQRSSASSLSAPGESAHSASTESTLAEASMSSPDLWQKTGKNALLFILGGLAGISDTLPVAGAGVKAVAGSLRELIAKIEETRENKGNLQGLAERIGRLKANIEYRKSNGQKDDENPCRQALEDKLKELKRLVEDADKQNRLQEFFNSSDDKSLLGKYMSSLNALVGDLTNEDTTKILAIVSDWNKPQLTSVNAPPSGARLKKLWIEFVKSGNWDEITCKIESNRWMGGTYTSSSKFDQVTYQIQNHLFSIKWTIMTPYSQWYPGAHSGYIHLPTDFPFKPPKLYFATPLFSPNLNISGVPSIDLLWDAWGPKYQLKDIMDVMAFMLTVDPVYRSDYSDHLPNIPLNIHVLNDYVESYLHRQGKEAFCRAAIFFARVYASPTNDARNLDLIANPTVEAYELEQWQMVVKELLEFAKVDQNEPGKSPSSRPFENIKPGESLLSDLHKEMRCWAEILAPSYKILFNPPPKEEVEEILAKFASEKIGGEGLGEGA